jgi:hypothetical protein
MEYAVVLERFGYLLLSNKEMVKLPEQPEKPAVRIPGH